MFLGWMYYCSTIEVEGIPVTFVTCNYCYEYQKLQLGICTISSTEWLQNVTY